MSRLLMVLLAALAIVVTGCGPKPGEDGANADSTAVVDSAVTQEINQIAVQTPDLAVGQWVSYKVDTLSAGITISVVGEEQFQGVDCLWLQIEAPENTLVQILVDPQLLAASMAEYSAVMNQVLADPAAYFAAHTPDPQQMMSDTENIQKFMDFLSAIKVIKVSQNNSIVAYDISGVPAVLQPMLADSAFMSQLTSGMNVQMTAPGADSMQALLNEFEYSIASSQGTVGTSAVEGQLLTMAHEKGTVEVLLSGDLPILPLVSVRVTETESGETHTIEATGFGTEGAENRLTGAPAQTIDMAPMIQMMIQQAQSQAQAQGVQ